MIILAYRCALSPECEITHEIEFLNDEGRGVIVAVTPVLDADSKCPHKLELSIMYDKSVWHNGLRVGINAHIHTTPGSVIRTNNPQSDSLRRLMS